MLSIELLREHHDIVWRVTPNDNDPDEDVASTTTRVVCMKKVAVNRF